MSTIEDDNLTTDDVPETAEPAARGSILDGLRARRAEVAAETMPRLVLDVPGYGGRLVARYRYPERGYEAVTDAVLRAQDRSEPDGALHGNADVLISCCETLLGRRDDGKLADLLTDEVIDGDDVMPEQPVRFNRRLGELLGIDVPKEIKSPARYVCRHVFSPRAAATGIYDGDLGLMTQGGQVISWLQNGDAATSEAFVGES